MNNVKDKIIDKNTETIKADKLSKMKTVFGSQYIIRYQVEYVLRDLIRRMLTKQIRGDKYVI